MRVSKVFSFLFGILGTALMLLTVFLALTNLNSGVRMTQAPKAAQECTEDLMKALADGEYIGAEQMLYGDTTLGAPREAATEEGKLVWRAFLDSVEYTFDGDCYGGGSGICRDVTITTMDIASISQPLQQRAKALLDQRIADAKEVNNMNLVYEEDGSLKQEILDSVVSTAISQTVAEDAATLTYTVTLELVNEDGTWQVVPSPELLKAVSGGL